MDATGTMFRLEAFGQLLLVNKFAPVAEAACQRKSLALLSLRREPGGELDERE